jgi:hypothetical protein
LQHLKVSSNSTEFNFLNCKATATATATARARARATATADVQDDNFSIIAASLFS